MLSVEKDELLIIRKNKLSIPVEKKFLLKRIQF